MFTPYYRTILGNSTELQCEEEPDFNYSPYTIFCLRTKLEATVNSLLGPQYEISFLSVPKDQKMVLGVFISLRTEKVEPPKELQDAINLFCTQDVTTALLYRVERPLILENGQVIPMAWLTNMLPYVSLSPQLNPFVDTLGLQVDLSRYPEYQNKYQELLQETRRQLSNLYLRGYLLQAGSIADIWNLEVMDIQGLLYRPRWMDKSFAPDLVEFLRQRLAGEEYISFKVGWNNVVHHFLAQALIERNITDLYFYEDRLLVRATSFLEAAQLSPLVSLTVARANGMVILDPIEGKVVTYRVSVPPNFQEVRSLLVAA
jgi:hypothetical protein